MRFFCLLIAFGLLLGCSTPQTEIVSPSGILKIRFEIKESAPFYSASRNGAPVINPSKLGFELKDLPALSGNFKIISVTPSTFDETWTQPWGEVKDIRNHYNASVIALEDDAQRKLNIEFRAYDDGIAFRYEFPEQPNLKQFIITDELTEFALAKDFSAWWIPAYRKDPDIEMDSEFLFSKNKVSELPVVVHTPLTLESGDSLFVSIHEAALVDFAAMTLNSNSSNTLKAELVPWANGNKVETSAPSKSPWRTIQIANKPGDLITSYLILNLNEPNKLADVSWIKPGKYNGMWWGMHMNKFTWQMGPKHGATTQNVKQLIDFAAAHKLSAVLVEGWNPGWEGNWPVDGNFDFTKNYPDYDIRALAEYAKSKNIGLVGHHETGGNIANYEKQMDAAFDLLQEYGIQRLKTGYVNKTPAGEFHHGQFMVRHYQKVLETAAAHNVMLDVHEPIKDTGLRRTYPNMMTREGVRGTEYEAWSIGNTPAHTTIIPFTRGLAGPTDFTPGIFNIQFDKAGKFRVHSTLAKQLALYVVIYSPMQMAADLPENYAGNKAIKFIEDVPADWEDTKVLEGKIGEYITVVRKDRNSSEWFLGAITNEAARITEIKLDFLKPGVKYQAEIYRDGTGASMEANPLLVDITSQQVASDQTLNLALAPGGGTAIRFYEMKLSMRDQR